VTGIARVARPRLLAVLLYLVPAGCTCAPGDTTYAVQLATLARGDTFGQPVWGGISAPPPGLGDLRLIRVLMTADVLPTREPVEVFSGSAPLALAGSPPQSVREPGSCPGFEILYDLSALPAGEYTVVHRRSHAPPGLTMERTRWMLFEGEDALVTTLVLRAPAGSDASAPDSGL
jgi:hypothetical protein